ncbi:HNH endonuclease signature motif containing protein [Nocardioides sp. NPDC101246]|uniref:HNH endonuclease signature motif containing protein n=1 Tax=Nocardioides sp. NPDC101246 TaxID=3364336 RepID=UPI00380B4B5A
MERFWSKVAKTETCWIWSAYRDEKGYGSFGWNGKLIKAHRAAYELTFGPIPSGAHVLHSCDNPSCVNPDHLSLGTHTENMRQKVARGRDHNARKVACINGHPLDETNTYVTPDGRRNCRTCRTAAKRAYRDRIAQKQEAS